MQVKVLSRTEAMTALPRLAELLQDAVDNGASVGYLAPLSATAVVPRSAAAALLARA